MPRHDPTPKTHNMGHSPLHIVGCRFEPEPIIRWVIVGDKYDDSFFAGFWPDHEDYAAKSLPCWTHVHRWRNEYTSEEEAQIDAALLVELGLLPANGFIDVRKVIIL